jgi:hypothetical protein
MPQNDQNLDAARVYALLQEACRALERSGDTAIVAHVGHCMALIQQAYGVGSDHLDPVD